MDDSVDEFRSDRRTGADRVLVCNPASGSGDHAVEIRDRGRERGFTVRETQAAGDARRLAREAAVDGSSLVAVAGGDGTVNEVVHGLLDANALEQVDLAVIPTGTANLFARQFGLTDVDRAFAALDAGSRARIDVGLADGRPFVNTCLVGLSAEANTATPDALKRRLGAFAYVLTTLRHIPEYDGFELSVTVNGDATADETPETWQGTALLVLVGNAFRLPSLTNRGTRSGTDGRFEVTILEENGRFEGLEGLDRESLSQLLDRESAPITRFEPSSLTITACDGEPLPVSLDGESVSATELELRVRERCLSLFVDAERHPL